MFMRKGGHRRGGYDEASNFYIFKDNKKMKGANFSLSFFWEFLYLLEMRYEGVAVGAQVFGNIFNCSSLSGFGEELSGSWPLRNKDWG